MKMWWWWTLSFDWAERTRWVNHMIISHISQV